MSLGLRKNLVTWKLWQLSFSVQIKLSNLSFSIELQIKSSKSNLLVRPSKSIFCTFSNILYRLKTSYEIILSLSLQHKARFCIQKFDCIATFGVHTIYLFMIPKQILLMSAKSKSFIVYIPQGLSCMNSLNYFCRKYFSPFKIEFDSNELCLVFASTKI